MSDINKIHYKNIEKLFEFTRQTWAKWQKEKRPIIDLLNYFDNNDIAEILNNGKIAKMEKTNDLIKIEKEIEDELLLFFIKIINIDESKKLAYYILDNLDEINFLNGDEFLIFLNDYVKNLNNEQSENLSLLLKCEANAHLGNVLFIHLYNLFNNMNSIAINYFINNYDALVDGLKKRMENIVLIDYKQKITSVINIDKYKQISDEETNKTSMTERIENTINNAKKKTSSSEELKNLIDNIDNTKKKT